MVQKAILAIFLVVVVGIAAMCGRERAPAPADTPVPTPTELPTTVATTTQTATAVPMPSAPADESVLASTVEPTVEPAVESADESEADSDTVPESRAAAVGIDATDAVTDTESTVPITVTASTTATIELTATVTVTIPVTPSATETPTATQAITGTPTVVITMTRVVTAAVTATVPPIDTPRPTATNAATPTSSPSPSPTSSPTATPSSTATPRPTVTATPSPSATVAPTSTPTETPTSVPTSTPTVEIIARPRLTVSLPTDLATSVQISRVTYLTDLVADVQPMAAELAPDGTKVAWLVPAQARRPAMLCVASLAGSGENCVAAPRHEGMPYHLVWSPDSQWLAFSEDPAAQALESDIWLWDVARGELQNRTDDGVMGRYAEAVDDFALDYLPMWDAATGYLYFWRSTPRDADGFDLALMRLDPDRPDDPQVVRDFGQTLGAGMLRFGWQRFYLQGPAAISPDGLQLAVALAPAQEMDVASDPALWLIDLTDPEAAPTPLANSLAWQEALPQWSNQPAVVRGLQWSADGRGLIVAALSSDLRLPLLLAYYVDVASGEVTPVVDFSDSRNRDAFFRLDANSGRAPRFDVPWTLALAPDANVLLMVTDLGGSVQVLGAELPPSGDAPLLLHVHRSPGYEVWTRSSGGGDVLLVYGMVLTLAPD